MIKKKISRRQFLQIVVFSGAAGTAIKLGLDTISAGEIVTETRLLMGTVVNIKAFGLAPRLASEAINASFARMAAQESVLSRFLPESQLSVLNQVGILSDPHPALLSVLQQSQELSRLTDGAFDITINPLLALYQSGENLPNDEEVQRSLASVNYRNLNINNHTVSFQQPDMSITLDGVAKGFIVDEGVAELQKFGFESVMIEAGGDLMAMGEKAPTSGWKIGLQAPRAEMGNLLTTIPVKNQALATSGDYMQAFTADFANHHIIDPRRGYSSTELASVSVIAPSAMLADGLATSVMVMGEAGLSLIEQMLSCEAYAVTKNALHLRTSGFGES